MKVNIGMNLQVQWEASTPPNSQKSMDENSDSVWNAGSMYQSYSLVMMQSIFAIGHSAKSGSLSFYMSNSCETFY